MALGTVALCAACTWMHAVVFDSTQGRSSELPLSTSNTTFGACFYVQNATGIGRIVFPISADASLEEAQIRTSVYALEGTAHPRIHNNSSTHHTRWLTKAFFSTDYRFVYVDLGLGVGVDPTDSEQLGICVKVEMLDVFDVPQPFSIAALNNSEPPHTAFGWSMIASGPWDAIAVQHVPDNGFTDIQPQSGEINKLAIRVHGRVRDTSNMVASTPAVTPSGTPSVVPTALPSSFPSSSYTATASSTASSSATPSYSSTPTASSTAAPTPSYSYTPTALSSATLTPSDSYTPTASGSATPSASSSISTSASPSPSPSTASPPSSSVSATVSPSPSTSMVAPTPSPYATFAAAAPDGATDIGANSAVPALASVGGDVYVGNAANPIYTTEFKAKGIARYNSAAKTWNKLPCGTDNGVNGAVNTILADGTSIIIGGTFTALSNGTAALRVVRYEEPGIWTNLTSSSGITGVNADVNVLAMYASKVYACGTFIYLSDGSTAYRVASFDPATSTWSALISGTNNGIGGTCYAMIPGGDGLYVGGNFNKLGDQSTVVNYVAKWDGTTWSQLTGYLSGVQSTVLALAYISPYLYMGTQSTSFGITGSYNYLARWDGTTFSNVSCKDSGNGVSATVRALGVVGTDLIIQGDFTYYGRAANNATQAALSIVRYTPSTGVYSPMGKGFDSAGAGPYMMSIINSTVWAATGVLNGNGDSLNYMSVYNGSQWNGVTATPANVGVMGDVKAMHMANGTTLMYIGGTFINLRGGMRANYIATYDTVTKAWGQLSVNGAVGVNNEVYAIAAISATEVYIGGKFTATKSGLSVGGIVKWNGTAWTALQDGFNNGITAGTSYVMAIAKLDNNVFVGGLFASLSNGTTASRLAKWDGTTWGLVMGGTKQGVNNNVNSLLTVGSTLYIGGTFSSATNSSIAATRFVKWTAAGGLQQASLSYKGVGSSGGVYALAYDGTYIYIGGSFSYSVVGTVSPALTLNSIARFDPVTDQWTAFSVNSLVGLASSVNAVCTTETGVYVGGNFVSSTSGATTLNYVGGWNKATSSWLQLGNPTLPGLDNSVSALYCFNGTLYMGGSFVGTKDDQALRKFAYISI
jgi:hypothetical protein